MAETEEPWPALNEAINGFLVPFQAVVSKPAQRAYLGTVLCAATILALLFTSTVAYALFYYNYIPPIGVERIIHLQFGNGPPHGAASLSSSLVSLQPYDISLVLHLPRTPANLAAGNFMLDLFLVSPSATSTFPSISAQNTSSSILAHSRRPAILPYYSPVVHVAHMVGRLPWYLLGYRLENEVLAISMFEGVEFSRGWRNVPEGVQLLVEADKKMQFYEARVKIYARFRGLRYLVYNHRILSYVFFTTTFFLVSLTSALLTYLTLSGYLTESLRIPKVELPNAVKQETSNSDTEQFNPFSTSDLSDTSRTFPTLGRQMPLHFSSRPHDDKGETEIKREEEIERTTNIPPQEAEADDEDEFEDNYSTTAGWRDSGIGTSLDDDEGRAKLLRRNAPYRIG